MEVEVDERASSLRADEDATNREVGRRGLAVRWVAGWQEVLGHRIVLLLSKPGTPP